jgi:hypothetical protein
MTATSCSAEIQAIERLITATTRIVEYCLVGKPVARGVALSIEGAAPTADRPPQFHYVEVTRVLTCTRMQSGGAPLAVVRLLAKVDPAEHRDLIEAIDKRRRLRIVGWWGVPEAQLPPVSDHGDYRKSRLRKR